MEPSEHLERSELRRFFSGTSPEAEAERVLEHLLGPCPECRDEARSHWPPGGAQRGAPAARRGQTPRPAADPQHTEAFEAALAAAEARLGEIDAERARAESAVAALLALPAAEQEARLAAEPALGTPAALDRLLQVVRQTGFRDPAEYVRLAGLAVELAERLPAERYGEALRNDLAGRARCHLANAHKVVGELDLAEEQFVRAENLLERGSGDPFRRARLLTLRASLRAVERRFGEADRDMRRALGLYRRLGERHWVARTQTDRAVYRLKDGAPGEAIELLLEALDLLEAQEEWRQALVAHHTLALAYLETGDLMRSRAHLGEARRLHERDPREVALVRLAWLEGKLAWASGDAAAAEERFAGVRDYFLERGIAHEVANVGLDLAMIYLESGRWADLAETAAMMVEVYRSKRIHREAIAALTLFRDAAAAQTATLELVDELRRYLEQAAERPGERFEPSG